MSGHAISGLEHLVTQERRDSILRLRNIDDKARCLAAGLLVRRAEDITGCKMAYNADGKPTFPGSKWHLSISHSGDYAVCAVSEYVIGVDIERIGDPIRGLAGTIFTDVENERIFGLDDTLVENECYRMWTLKESYLKALGTGLSKDPKSFSVIAEGDPYVIDPDRPDGEWCFVGSNEFEGYALSLCISGSDNRVSWIEIPADDLPTE